MDSFKTDWIVAKAMIRQFIDKVDLPGRRVPLGGTINIETLYGKSKTRSLYNGNMAWYCWGHTPHQLFLAFEENPNYDQTVEILNPTADTLICPTNIFYFPDDTDLDQFLDYHTIKPPFVDLPILCDAVDGVIELKNKFKQSGPLDNNGLPFNNYPYGFFENKEISDIDKFVKQNDIAFIRYYFGLQDDQEHLKTNRIRLILVGVDANGKNIIPNSYRTSDSVWVLEQSWPPPPPIGITFRGSRTLKKGKSKSRK